MMASATLVFAISASWPFQAEANLYVYCHGLPAASIAVALFARNAARILPCQV